MTTTGLSWETPQWRDGHLHTHPQSPLTTAAVTHDSVPHTSFYRHGEYASTSQLGRHVSERTLPSFSQPVGNVESAFSYPQDRHMTDVPRGYGPQLGKTYSPVQSFQGSWRSLQHDDHRPMGRHISDPPLTLHIPNPQDRSRAYPSHPPDSQSHSVSHSAQSTSLPSFAAFREHASRSDDQDDGPDIASMGSRLSCFLCVKLLPMVQEVASAVADLDETVQVYCSKSTRRTNDIPNDSPVRALQWVLDTVKHAKSDLKDPTSRSAVDYGPRKPNLVLQGLPPRLPTPTNLLKREREPFERDEHSAAKRQRGNSSELLHRRASTPAGRDERDAETRDFGTRQLPRGQAYSPQPTESVPGSANPRNQSPGLVGRTFRVPPSPSSLVWPSVPPSYGPLTAQSVGSPTTSYHQGSSIHTAQTSSVASAHLADLQHQVTLKSLALQTLQSEYASLLQKFQRERVKSQAIEKKTTVADKEVNDLTNRNEDLSDSVKSLEIQLEESEKRRENERADAAKEKEQWGRMLAMGGQLHAKNAEERKKLLQEKSRLELRVETFEEENRIRFEQMKSETMDQMDGPRRSSGGSEKGFSKVLLTETTEEGRSRDLDQRSSDSVRMRREILGLKSRIEPLRAALVEARKQGRNMREQVAEAVLRSGEIDRAVDRALERDEMNLDFTSTGEKVQKSWSGRSTPSRGKSPWSPEIGAVEPRTLENTASTSGRPDEERDSPRKDEQRVDGEAPDSDMNRSSGPYSSLGFDVAPTKSSPEELVAALGPAPAPLPENMPYALSYYGEEHRMNLERGRRKMASFGHAPMLHDPTYSLMPLLDTREVDGSGSTRRASLSKNLSPHRLVPHTFASRVSSLPPDSASPPSQLGTASSEADDRHEAASERPSPPGDVARPAMPPPPKPARSPADSTQLLLSMDREASRAEGSRGVARASNDWPASRNF